MPYSFTPPTVGAYTNVSGATTAVAGQVVQSAVWDNIHNDIGTALTNAMSQLISMPTNRNLLWMNGGVEIWQQGSGNTSSIAVASAATQYTADRWYLLNGASLAQVVSAQVGLSSQSALCARTRRNVGITTSTDSIFAYPLDSDEISRMLGKIATFSCLVKTGANWSPTNGTLVVTLYVGTAAVSKRGATPYAGETSAISISTNLAAGSAATAISGSSSAIIPTTTTCAELQFKWTPTGAAGAADDISIDDIQLEVNTSASTWSPTYFDRVDFPTMLQGCKRYFQKTFTYGVAPAQGATRQNAISAIANNSQFPYLWWQFPVEMRVTASITTYNTDGATANWWDVTGGTSINVSAGAFSADGSKGILIYGVTVTATVVPHLMVIHAAVSAGI